MVLKKVDYNIIINENKDIESRMIEIKELKTFLETIGFGYDQAYSIINYLETYENYSIISRAIFKTVVSNFKWDAKTVAKFFVVFDQNGNDFLTTLSIKTAISLLVSNIDKKLELFFKSSNQDEAHLVLVPDFMQLIYKIEENLYILNSFYNKNLEKFSESLRSLSQESFISLLKTDVFFNNILKPLADIDSVGYENINNYQDIPIEPEDYFNELSSPEKSPISAASDILDTDDNLSELKLTHDIEIIGEKSLEISMLSNEPNSSTSKKTLLANYENIEEHGEKFEIVKDPDFQEKYKMKSIASEVLLDDKNKEFFIESQKDIDYLPIHTADKERNACSRLCTKQPCIVF